MTNHTLSTKAETLKLLYGQLKTASVLEQFSFTVKDWNENKESLISQYLDLPWSDLVIVRSSSLNEDTSESSLAGKYESIPNVSGKEQFCQAVDRVIASYGDNEGANQILVQPMLRDVFICGVAFTIDPNTLGNYYVINYDANGSTSAVTSGEGKDNFLYYQFKGAKAFADARMGKLCETLGELEAFFGQDNLDVEFAFTKDETLYILQVRPLCLKGEVADYDRQKKDVEHIKKKIQSANVPKPYLFGKKTIYSVMTDWNPAEMIGVRPKPLAMSLYKEIITDNVWAYQRDNYGYRNLRSFPLMVDFCGLPYIDVRVSFNSFIPAELDVKLSDKLVNYYLDRLTENPLKHDKAEFEIVFSCYTLDLQERIQILKNYGFSEREINSILDALRNVTNRISDSAKGLWKKDLRKIDVLNERYEKIVNSNLDDVEKIYWLIEDCKRYGTLPFAGLARAAFIAVQMLQSMVNIGIISKQDYEDFMNGVNTVSSDINHDFYEMSKASFLRKYGHLRPGTYDINSKRYDEEPDLYFDWDAKNKEDSNRQENNLFRMSLEQMNMLKEKLEQNGLNHDILGLMDFIKKVIEGREYGKFAFTRNVSKILQLLGDLGRRMGFDKEACSFLDIHDVMRLYASSDDMMEIFSHSIKSHKAAYEKTMSLNLPPVITAPADAVGFFYPDSETNFITCKCTSGEVFVLEDIDNIENMNGKIVLITSADPGYDWIFSHEILGFVTMYGGANSHMAIRAGELGIPAAVGVGSKKFNHYKTAKNIEIDTLAKIIRVLK